MPSSLYRLMAMHRDRRKPIQGILRRRVDKIAQVHLPRRPWTGKWRDAGVRHRLALLAMGHVPALTRCLPERRNAILGAAHPQGGADRQPRLAGSLARR